MPWSTFITSDDTRLSRRLCYILRYAAIDLGLCVSDGGYVVLDDVMQLSMIREYSRDTVIDTIDNDKTSKGVNRFHRIQGSDGIVRVRASYNRRIERSRYHESSKVVRLLDTCFEYVTKEIERYDVANLPTAILNNLIYRLNKQRRLNRNSLLSIAGPNVETLNLTSCYLTPAGLRLVSERCTQLRSLILRDQGYLITDHALIQCLKSIPQLEVLSLRNCSHITDLSIDLIMKRTPNLRYLNLVGCTLLSQESKFRCLLGLKHLNLLEVSGGGMDVEYISLIREAASQRQVKVHIMVEHKRTQSSSDDQEDL